MRTVVKDRYANFEELQSVERNGIDYCVSVSEQAGSPTVILAPHGGGIEPGTSEIAVCIAARDCSVALFEGKRQRGNSDLHITSTNFDEPNCLTLVQSAHNVIAIHGERRNDEVVFLGGADTKLGAFIRVSLESHGFTVDVHGSLGMQGTSRDNICNRGVRGKGVQLELSVGLREAFFESLSAKGRRSPTENLSNFSNAVREGLRNGGAI